ncbi:MAG: ferritin-like domain-containing protein [Campylobacterota bacterium]|nr:ferritin-like domain-containing protein [Campylobacterota bacterium]
MDFFRILHTILTTQLPSEKIARFKTFYEAYKRGDVSFEENYLPACFDHPSYSGFCKIVAPQAVPKRKNLAQKAGQVLLLHAIAHIEYSAIDLALDHAYRFTDMPKAYYDEWLEVADDEIRHFEMIEGLLKELGSRYGEVEVHNALFEASQRTHSLLERMAVVPRFLEANGLDATPEIATRLKRVPQSEMIDKILAALDVIVEEEVDHVLKGDRWFNYACEREGVDRSVYFDIIEKYYPESFPRQKGLNVTARKEAGFSCGELNKMSVNKVC